MKLPDSALALVRLAIDAGDPYSAAAVYELAKGEDKDKLESLMFGLRRHKLLLARWEHTPGSVLDALANSGDKAVVVRLDKNPNTPTQALSRLFADKPDSKAGASLKVLIAQHPHVSTTLLKDVVTFENDLECLKAVSKNPAADAEVLSVLLSRMSSGQQIGIFNKNIAENPSTSADLLTLIFTKGDAYTRAAVIKHLNCPQALLNQAVDDDNVFIKRALASDERLPKEVLLKLATHQDKPVRSTVAANPATPRAIIKLLIQDNSYAVRRSIASRADLTMASIQQLVDDRDDWVRQRLARNPKVPSKVLEQLSTDHQVEVRRGVARNIRCPVSLLKELAKDENYWVRSAVAYQHKSPKELMVKLADDTEIDVQSGVANNPKTPQRLLKMLATSTNADVRRGVILNRNATRTTLLPLLEDPYYLHRILLAFSSKLNNKDKWTLCLDTDFQVRFSAFRYFTKCFKNES
ncbi:MAG: hypothetical protein WBP13_02100 [Methylophilaceae bacterium]